MYKRAMYAGSFDPLTNGHLHIIKAASRLFDTVIVNIGTNPAKKSMFTPEERLTMIETVVKHEKVTNVHVTIMGNRFLMHEAIDQLCTHVVRGIRTSRDFEDEWGMYVVNLGIASVYTGDYDDIPQTVFIPADPDLADVSSSMVKSLIGFEGWQEHVQFYLPSIVAEYVISKFA
jgi:pantetheine-phosphate adenylyltransferase